MTGGQVTHEDAPTFEPIRRPDLPPHNRGPRRMHRKNANTARMERRNARIDAFRKAMDSPYRETSNG